jgi:putative membrane protein
MKRAFDVLAGLVMLLHIAIMLIEMFFWDHPIGYRIFNTTVETAPVSAVLAANQGLYNGFLAAGLGWALISDRRDLKLFFLGCVAVAGLMGGLTAKTSILFTQGLPALVAMIGIAMTQSKQAQPKQPN